MDLDNRDDSGSTYSGYVGGSSGSSYHKKTGTPSVRTGSSMSNSVRGGGPGAGK